MRAGGRAVSDIGREADRFADAEVAGTISLDDTHLLIRSAAIWFGRSESNDVRLGHSPVVDDLVPRVAGRVWAHCGRILVANEHERLSFDIRIEGRPPMSVAPGHWVSPADAEFEIVISGALQYVVSVATRPIGVRVLLVPASAELGGELVTSTDLELTERQRRILAAYVAPMIEGGAAATHGEVARVVSLSRSMVRVECNKIWSKMLLAGIPLRDLPDVRDQIVDAWNRHRL